MAPLTCVNHVLRRQFGVIRLAEPMAAGFSKGAIRHLVRTERLRRLYRGVFVAEGRPDSPQQRALAAVSACGEGAALSHVSAAVLWHLLSYPPSLPQLTVPGKTGRRGPKGVAFVVGIPARPGMKAAVVADLDRMRAACTPPTPACARSGPPSIRRTASAPSGGIARPSGWVGDPHD
ncbi:MAG: type IV toxin-antitoxin system AbiEi family antitoxin domain-containing protein [Solirubrobacteraceae bacterium]